MRKISPAFIIISPPPFFFRNVYLRIERLIKWLVMKKLIYLHLFVCVLFSCGTSESEVSDKKELDDILDMAPIEPDDIVLKPKDHFLNEYGIHEKAYSYVAGTEFFSDIREQSCWTETLSALKKEIIVPEEAKLISSVVDLMKLASGEIYYVKGDLIVPTLLVGNGENKHSKGITIPNNVTIYIEGSIYKEGLFMGDQDLDDGIEEENKWDYIFNLEKTKNVNIYGINHPKIYSKKRSVAFYMGGEAQNIHIEGFYVTDVWEAFSCQWGAKDITLLRNYIQNTGKRAIWMLGTENTFFAYNFIYLPGWDGFDFDAYNKDGNGYGNIVIGAGRWAGFVEEAAQNNYTVNSLCVMEPTLSTEKNWQMGFADNGTTQKIIDNSGKVTENNYFIKNVTVQPISYTQTTKRGGGNFFSKKNAEKGLTFFWGNIEKGCTHSTSGDSWYKAEWLDEIPEEGINKIKELKKRLDI